MKLVCPWCRENHHPHCEWLNGDEQKISNDNFPKRFTQSRAMMFLKLYLSFAAIFVVLGVWRHGIEQTEHMTSIIALASMGAAFVLEHLYHWSRKL